ncbi:MAG: phosphoribosyltransferase [Burkholderiaceae bacterium]|nr:phosphoribosyltransferase [Burkholderiaceae bacterium]
MKDLHVSWDEYHRLIEKLAYNVYDSGWKFDAILCLARGGLRPGDMLSRIFDMPLSILSTSSYREAAGTVQGELDIGQYIASSRPGVLKGKVLLVDDLVDSGLTFKKVTEHLSKTVPAITEVRTAVIWWKSCSLVKPDYYVDYLETNPWIHQPFEEYDSMTLGKLVSKVEGYGK